MKALALLELIKMMGVSGDIEKTIDESINELVLLEQSIKTSIEEIEYAIAKPEYSNVYLNNAIRFLKGDK